MQPTLFTEFGIVLAVAAVMALLMRLLRQPLIIGHIITGIIVGPFALGLMGSGDIFQFLSQIGIAFLLFSVGLNLNPRVLRDYGTVALMTGLGQVSITAISGFFLSRLLGFAVVPSLYIAIALSFSSTIIILKLISDRGDLEKLYAKIAIGFLLVQDLIALVLLFSIPLLGTEQGGSMWGILFVLGKALALAVAVFFFARYVLVPLHPYISRSQELLFLFATAWGIGVAVMFKEVGFSLETGALIAGVSLALLPSRHEIHARLSPLRDFFIVVFFVVLGSQISLAGVKETIPAALAFSALVLIGNPLIMMSIMGFLGYRRKTSLQTGFTVSQVSEFSLILVALGVSVGHVGSSLLSMITLVGLITIFGSSYLILYSDTWYRFLGPYLRIFERKHVREQTEQQTRYDIVLFGGNRIGFDFIEAFKGKGEGQDKLLVVDHDPEIIGELSQAGVDHVFGDASDADFLDSLKLGDAKLVISTVPNLDVNLLIIEKSRREERVEGGVRVPVMAVAHSITNALALYEAGAAYVILPHFLGAKYASGLAVRLAGKLEDAEAMREEHIAHLRRRATLGHEHPVIERYR